MRFCQVWLLLPQRIALHEPTQTAVVADVHLGYGVARQKLGDAIPARSVAEEMRPLILAAQSHPLRQLVVAGDLFERRFDPALFRRFLEVLEGANVCFVGLAPGNHDRGLEASMPDLPLFTEGYDLDGWRIAHGDSPVQANRAVMGHWHPAVRRKNRKYPCFLSHERQLILPAFSLDAAGVDVSGEPRWKDWKRFAIVNDQIEPAEAP